MNLYILTDTIVLGQFKYSNGVGFWDMTQYKNCRVLTF